MKSFNNAASDQLLDHCRKINNYLKRTNDYHAGKADVFLIDTANELLKLYPDYLSEMRQKHSGWSWEYAIIYFDFDNLVIFIEFRNNNSFFKNDTTASQPITKQNLLYIFDLLEDRSKTVAALEYRAWKEKEEYRFIEAHRLTQIQR